MLQDKGEKSCGSGDRIGRITCADGTLRNEVHKRHFPSTEIYN